MFRLQVQRHILNGMGQWCQDSEVDNVVQRRGGIKRVVGMHSTYRARVDLRKQFKQLVAAHHVKCHGRVL